jgi:ribosomal protein S18 acetylase RimI-like enzyme
MSLRIEPYADQQRGAVVELSLRAWEPVFASLRTALGPAVYQALVPDWRVSQRQAVEGVCAADDSHVWVALDGEAPVGFVALKLHSGESMGEIYMLAVDPAAQGRGVGSALTDFALARMKAAGMAVAMVETGGDPGHAPARRTYEKAGFDLLPIARYFKKL